MCSVIEWEREKDKRDRQRKRERKRERATQLKDIVHFSLLFVFVFSTKTKLVYPSVIFCVYMHIAPYEVGE